METNGLTWVTVAQAAKLTGVPRRTVHSWAYRGRIPYRQSVRTEGYSKVVLEAVEALARARMEKQTDGPQPD